MTDGIHLGDLRALQLLSEEGSVLAAAEAMGVSRSVVRRQLKNLEAQVGLPLLRSHRGGATLTPAGEVVLQRGRRLLQEAASMRAAAQATGKINRPLRVIVPMGMPTRFLSRVELLVHQSLPSLRFSVREVEAPLEHLQEPVELVFHVGPPPKRGVYFSRALIRCPLRLLGSSEYLARRGVPGELEALAEHDLLSWSCPHLRPDAWPRASGGAVTIAPWLRSPNVHMLRYLVAQGGGLSLLPDGGNFDEPEIGRLVPVLDGVVGKPMSFRVLAPRPVRTDPHLQKVVETLLELVRSLPEPPAS